MATISSTVLAPVFNLHSDLSNTSKSVCRSALLQASGIRLQKREKSYFTESVKSQVGRNTRHIVCVAGDVSPEGTNYLIAGAIAIAVVGSALPIIFSRKDVCPVCDGAGFVRASGVTLRSNAARKDLAQIVCKNCSGLGKIGQTDKKGMK